MRTISCFAALVILCLVGSVAQTASAVPPVTAQEDVYGPGEQSEPGGAPGTAPAGLFPFNWDGPAVCEACIFLANQPSNPGKTAALGQRLPPDLNRTDDTSPAMSRADRPSLHALPLNNVRPDNMAFLRAALQTRNESSTLRDKAAPLILGLAVHAALTWDAQSTNHFFHHYPNGFKPVEVDPLMRPFAGKALMYPMANILFGVPVDLLLLKTRRDRKLIRTLTYAAASYLTGLEIRQSIVNIRNEHVNRATGAFPTQAITRTN